MATSARPPALPARKHQSSALMLTFGSANTLIRARSRRRKLRTGKRWLGPKRWPRPSSAAEESFNVSFAEKKGTDAIDTESASWRERTKWIIELADLQKKAEYMKLMLCPYSNGDPAMAADACVNVKCSKCGFSYRWKKLRAALLQHGPASFVPGGNQAGIQLQPGAPSVFHETRRVGYIRIGSSGQAC